MDYWNFGSSGSVTGFTSQCLVDELKWEKNAMLHDGFKENLLLTSDKSALEICLKNSWSCYCFSIFTNFKFDPFSGIEGGPS